ncbi:MAG: hypothetical protein L0Y79_09055 [Chlorobi bacterium]|nr:hypothetical protein [Chlorobiota bacterium]MCI0716952.1 hypothetical protein [Chlorobiota bacterium]
MTDKNKYIEEFIDNKLKKSFLKKTSGNFTKLLMERVHAENKSVLEETKRDRIAKYVIASFSTFIIAFTVAIGYLSGTKGSVPTNSGTGVNIDSTIESSSGFFQQFLYYIQSFFVKTLEFLGVSISPNTLLITMVVIFVVGVFLLGERIFIRSKYKSSVQLK